MNTENVTTGATYSVKTLRIKSLREKYCYTQKQLADLVGIQVAQIREYEEGRAFPPNDVLYRMCEIFSVSYAQLIGAEATGYPSVDRPWKKYYDEAAFSAVIPSCSIYEMVYANNKDRLKEVAIEYFKTRVTYGQLFTNIQKTRDAFIRLGVKRDDVVTLLLPNIPESVYCVYALSRIGAIANMVDLRLAGQKLANYINSVHSDVVVCSDVFAHNIAEIQDLVPVKHFIVLTPFDSMAAPVRTVLKLKNKRPAVKEIRNRLSWADFIRNGKGVVAEDYPADSDDVICIFHTSGTTAMPKSVMMTNGNMNALGFCYQYVPFDIQDGDRFLSNVPPFLVYNTIFTVHMPLVRRMTVVMLPIAPMSEFADIIMKYKPNHVGGSAAGWREFPKNPATETADLSFLKACCSGNDSLALETKLQVNEILNKGGCPYGVMEGYGMTEAGSAVASCWPAMEVKNSIGVPLWINIVSIFDPDDCDRELTYNEVGEICVYGPSVMAGYYDDEKATADVMRLHSDGRVWLHSKDLGHMDENGALYFDGRLKRTIITHVGSKIAPMEYERLLIKHDNVESCCVVGRKDPDHSGGQVPVAFLVLKDKGISGATIEELKELMDRQFAENTWIYEYRVIEKLPMTSMDKIDYRAMEKMAEK